MFIAFVVASVTILVLITVAVIVFTKAYKSPEWRHCVAEGPVVGGQSQSELESMCDKVVEESH